MPRKYQFYDSVLAEAFSCRLGYLAQLVEHLVYTEKVSGSNPLVPILKTGRSPEALTNLLNVSEFFT